MSPKEPEPIFLPKRYLFPTLSSMIDSGSNQWKREKMEDGREVDCLLEKMKDYNEERRDAGSGAFSSLCLPLDGNERMKGEILLLVLLEILLLFSLLLFLLFSSFCSSLFLHIMLFVWRDRQRLLKILGKRHRPSSSSTTRLVIVSW